MQLFLLLGEWAWHDNTNHLLNERLVLIQIAASQIDGFLQEAIAELEQAHRFANFDPLDPDLTISEPFLDPLKRHPVVAITGPIRDDDHFSGFFSGLVDLSGTAISLC